MRAWPSRSTWSRALADPEAKVRALDPRRRSARGGRREGADPDRRSADRRRPASGAMQARRPAAPTCSNAPDARARVFARLAARARRRRCSATANGYVKVALGDGRFALREGVGARAGRHARRRRSRSTTRWRTRRRRSRSRSRSWRRATPTRWCTASASDDARLLDAYIFVGSRKVFYRSNRNGADPKRMAFDADLPLRPGVNVVTVVARENPDTTTRRTFIVRRDGAERRAPRRRRRPTTSSSETAAATTTDLGRASHTATEQTRGVNGSWCGPPPGEAGKTHAMAAIQRIASEIAAGSPQAG